MQDVNLYYWSNTGLKTGNTCHENWYCRILGL